MTYILSNKIQCKKCKDIIESKHRHDFRYCSCGSVAVDGGTDYLRRLGNFLDYIELSIVKAILETQYHIKGSHVESWLNKELEYRKEHYEV